MILYPCVCVFHRSRRYYKFSWPETACSSPGHPARSPAGTNIHVYSSRLHWALSERVGPAADLLTRSRLVDVEQGTSKIHGQGTADIP